MGTFGFLTAMNKAQLPDLSFKARLHKHLTGTQAARPLGRLHASSVTKVDWCARRVAIFVQTGTPQPDEYLSTSSAVTFGIGHAVQDMVVSWAADMGLAVGHWSCFTCNQRFEFCKRPAQCPYCGRKQFRPIEVRVLDSVSGISCGIDLLLDMGQGKLIPVEIKTIAPDVFKTLAAPLAEHKARTSIYLRTIEADDEYGPAISCKFALVLYVTKGGFGVKDTTLAQHGIKEAFSPFKEFFVSRDDAMAQPLWDSAKSLTDWRKQEGAAPPERICASQDCAMAAACPVRAYCFGSLFGD